MIRLGTLRIIGVPLPPQLRIGASTVRRHVNDAVGYMGVAFAHHWQAVAVCGSNSRRPVNDAVDDMGVAFAHHWHAFLEFGIVLASFSDHFGIVLVSLLRIVLTMLRRCCSNAATILIADDTSTMMPRRFSDDAMTRRRRFAEGSRCRGSCFGANVILRGVSAYHWQAFGGNGLSMMRLGTWYAALRIIGEPFASWRRVDGPTVRRHVNDAVGEIIVAFTPFGRPVMVAASS